MIEKFELICDDVFITLYIGTKYYLPMGLVGEAEILDGILTGYVMIDFKNVKVNETSEPGPLNLTFTVDEFNKKFKKI